MPCHGRTLSLSPTSHPAVTTVQEAYRRMLAARTTKKEPLTVADMRMMVKRFAGPQATLMDTRTVTICLLSS